MSEAANAIARYDAARAICSDVAGDTLWKNRSQYLDDADPQEDECSDVDDEQRCVCLIRNPVNERINDPVGYTASPIRPRAPHSRVWMPQDHFAF